MAQIEALPGRLAAVPPQRLKVLVTHHAFLPPPGAELPPLVERADLALRAAEAGGVDLMLAGHLHRGYSGDARTYYANVGRAIVMVQAGTATSNRLRNEANSYNLIHLSPQRIAVSVRAWDGVGFCQTRSSEYVKNGAGWLPARPSPR